MGSFCQERSFAAADPNDRLWSDAAGRSWRDLPFKACPVNANLVIEDRPSPGSLSDPLVKAPKRRAVSSP